MRLPLASFDALLRVVGPLLPFLALAARMAVQVWIGAQQDHWRGWTEAGLVYAAVTVSRGAIYLTHRAGGCSIVTQLSCRQAWSPSLGMQMHLPLSIDDCLNMNLLKSHTGKPSRACSADDVLSQASSRH